MDDREELTALRRLAELEAKASASAPAARQMGAAEGAGRLLQRGLTMGWSDEISGAADAAVSKLRGDERPFGELYDASRARYAGEEQRFTQERPNVAALSEGTGAALTAVPAMMVSGGASVPATLGQMMARGGAAGATYGAVAGAAGAEPGQRTEGANQGAAVGGLFGLSAPLAPYAVQGAQRVGRAAGQWAGNIADLVRPSGPSRIAARTVQDMVGDDARGPLVEALTARSNFPERFRPTAAQKVQGTPEGTLIQSMEAQVARAPGARTAGGNPSVMFARRDAEQAQALEAAKEARKTVTSEMRERALTLANMTTERLRSLSDDLRSRLLPERDLAVADDFGSGARERQAGLQQSAERLMTQGDDAGAPVTPARVQSVIREILTTPGDRASTVVQRSMSSIDDRLSKITGKDGTINSFDLYTLRKELGNEIESAMKESASWDKRLAGGLRTRIDKAIDETLEGALPPEARGAWREYLQTYSARSKQIDDAVEAAENAYKPGRPTNVSGQESGEISIPLPATLSRPGLLARSILGVAGRNVQPKVDVELARLMLDPDALAEILRAAPNRRELIDALSAARAGVPVTAAASSLMVR